MRADGRLAGCEAMENGGRKAALLGASGMTGRQLAELLVFDPLYNEVRLLLRTPLPLEGRRIVQSTVDFQRLNEHEALFAVNDLYICLGTTMRKAGSEEAFRQVDYVYPLSAARMAKARGVERVFVITALGSDPASSIFYNRVKGELERDLAALQLPELHIMRPSLLRGRRLESRPGEELAGFASGVFGFVFVGPLRRFRPIEAQAVARAMQALAHQAPAPGVHIHESEAVQAIADQAGATRN